MIKPVLTEKSLSNAKEGKYTFSVRSGMTKKDIKKAIEKAFGVHVKEIRTSLTSVLIKKDARRRKRVIPASKKAIVKLRPKEKIDFFEEAIKNPKKGK